MSEQTKSEGGVTSGDEIRGVTARPRVLPAAVPEEEEPDFSKCSVCSEKPFGEIRFCSTFDMSLKCYAHQRLIGIQHLKPYMLKFDSRYYHIVLAYTKEPQNRYVDACHVDSIKYKAKITLTGDSGDKMSWTVVTPLLGCKPRFGQFVSLSLNQLYNFAKTDLTSDYTDIFTGD